MNCSVTVRSKCQEQLLWAEAALKTAFMIGEMALDPSGKEWSWLVLMERFPDNPIVIQLKAWFQTLTGKSIKGMSRQEIIAACWEHRVSKSKAAGGCGDHPIPVP